MIRAAVALSVLLVVVVIAVAVVVTQQPNRPAPQPHPTPSSSSADPYAWYRSLPTATPGCPKTVDPGLEPYFRHCPIGATK
jgi:hypothetical protein